MVLANFNHPETTDLEEKRRIQNRDAEQLLRRTNRLLRWYRAVSRQSRFLELTRSQASPFLFEIVGTGDRYGLFNHKYDALVNAALTGEWAEAREFFTGVEFGLRNKMSAVMRLVANRSLFREPDDLWGKLSASYRKRNAIIHSGDNATEDEARSALQVARRVSEVMGSL